MITTQRTLNHLVIVAAAAFSLSVGTDVLAAEMGGNTTSAKAAPTPAVSAKDEHVRKAGSHEIDRRRHSLNKEAILATCLASHKISQQLGLACRVWC